MTERKSFRKWSAEECSELKRHFESGMDDTEISEILCRSRKSVGMKRFQMGLVVRAGELEKRFWRKVRKSEGCWIWRGVVTGTGYGELFDGEKTSKAHRIAWRLAHGEDPPDDLFVCHKCDNPLCVRPDHLFIGTPKDNSVDMKRKGRSMYGERHARHLFTEKTVKEIIRLYESGMKPMELQKLFGGKLGTIRSIAHGRRWRYLRDGN